ncbi:hypothetical protein TP47_20935 [Xanthomonas citri pv. aurantifolii]|nr:hypothetical protein TP37_13790 [Xanthomonas citri pv. aurantifolii]AMV04281.1 hypothetical protein TP50_18970 [Xanthomonas citri pv. aurantifolii]TBW93544.1 hypothetical protein TP47_20935 [Xanthomonas citri pv. aurantifolii]TBW96424.1 hypothetical protein TP49_12770 [Xanthomonas citri pv. aurantifolii]TBX04059.1 hypothetical protein TP46_07555 [Xanthomonas citri pv. aurantifolii]
MGLIRKNILSPRELPSTSETGAVIQNFFVRAQLHLSGDAKACAHLIDTVGCILILLYHLSSC